MTSHGRRDGADASQRKRREEIDTTQRKRRGEFVNTWSIDGFLSEGMQPAELGWGTHEKWFPRTVRKQKEGSKAAIFLEQPGANTRVRSWCPTPGPQYGLLVTHNEAISVADYFTVRGKKGGKGLAVAALVLNVLSLVIVFGLQSAWSAALS